MPVYNRLPFVGKFLKSSSRLNQQTPTALKSLKEEYKNDIGIGVSNTFSADIFDDLVKARAKDFGGFFKGKTDPKAKNGETQYTAEEKLLREKLGSNNVVKDAISSALEVQKDSPFTKAQTQYAKSINAFKTLIEEVPSKYKTQDLIATMTEIKNDAIKAIKEQQKLEKDSLTAKLAEPEVAEALKNALTNQDSITVEQAKESLISDLEKNHKSQLDTFSKSANTTLTDLHQASDKELERILFFANLHKNNKKMREVLETKMLEKRGLPEFAQADLGFGKNGVYLAQIQMEDVPTIETVSNRKIERKVTKNAKGENVVTYSMQTPRNLFGIKYYNDPRQNTVADMTTMAQALRASGYSTIKITIEYPDDPKLSQKRAKEAFEAAIRAGYKPEEISINYNGKMLKIDAKSNEIQSELFKEDPKSYQSLVGLSQHVTAELDKIKQQAKKEMETPSAAGMKDIKERLGKIMEAKEKEPKAEDNAAPAPK